MAGLCCTEASVSRARLFRRGPPAGTPGLRSVSILSASLLRQGRRVRARGGRLRRQGPPSTRIQARRPMPSRAPPAEWRVAWAARGHSCHGGASALTPLCAQTGETSRRSHTPMRRRHSGCMRRCFFCTPFVEHSSWIFPEACSKRGWEIPMRSHSLACRSVSIACVGYMCGAMSLPLRARAMSKEGATAHATGALALTTAESSLGAAIDRMCVTASSCAVPQVGVAAASSDGLGLRADEEAAGTSPCCVEAWGPASR